MKLSSTQKRSVIKKVISAAHSSSNKLVRVSLISFELAPLQAKHLTLKHRGLHADSGWGLVQPDHILEEAHHW